MTETKPEQNILTEEKYLEEIGEIIERDFFPELTEARSLIHGESLPKRTPAKIKLNEYLARNTSEENLKFFTKLQDDVQNKRLKCFDNQKPRNNFMLYPDGLKRKLATNKLGIRYKNTRTVKMLQPQETAKENSAAQDFLSTPTPKPGEQGTPFISWGNILSTPVVLSPNNKQRSPGVRQ